MGVLYALGRFSGGGGGGMGEGMAPPGGAHDLLSTPNPPFTPLPTTTSILPLPTIPLVHGVR